MKTFLGILMVLIVSGDDEVTINGIVGDNVLLPCQCQNRNLREEFRWQKDEPDSVLVFSEYKLNESYTGRATIFHNEDISNCSLLLNNITAGDQGKYKCSFQVKERYNRLYVNLNVSANYSVCQKEPDTNQNDSLKVFQCDVEGHYRDTEIQWYQDGHLITNSSTTTISHTYSLNATTGLYRFNSKLTTIPSENPHSTCHVKAKGISTILYTSCISKLGHWKPDETPEPKYFTRHFKIIPIVLVLGFSLVLLGRWKLSRADYIDKRTAAGHPNC